MSKQKKYWKGIEELLETKEFKQNRDKEFVEEIPIEEFLGNKKIDKFKSNRRDFLKFLGFSISAASLAACETPVIRSIPYLNKPEEITPGVANWYASTFFDGNDFASILVKTREGRPILIEGNTDCHLTKGAINARINASVLSLYDQSRPQYPAINGKKTNWTNIDNAIMSELNDIASSKGNIRILTNSIISPSTKEIINKFIAKYNSSNENDEVSNVKHITYDAVSNFAIRKAHKLSFGNDIIPFYHFNKAKVIVSVDADFLANWILPTVFTPQYAEVRDPDKKWMTEHIQYEALLSLTGSNADKRYAIKASQYGLVIASIYNYIAKKSGVSTVDIDTKEVDNICNNTAKKLWNNKGKSLLVCGVNNVGIQILVNGINYLLGNYNTTLDVNKPINVKSGNDEDVLSLINEMKEGKVDALITYHTNPAYSLPDANEFKDALKKVKLSIAIDDKMTETYALAKYQCPDNHFLESWGDAEVISGHLTLMQPCISKLYDTRQGQDSLLKWSGNNTDYYNFLKKYWKENYYPSQNKYPTFFDFWVNTLQKGTYNREKPLAENQWQNVDFVSLFSNAGDKISKDSNKGYELILYQKVGIGEGNQINNPWLQELPDPITRITWDNYITISPSDASGIFASEYGQKKAADMASLSVNGKSIELPVVVQPGQAKGTLGIAVGYGRTKSGKVSEGLGKNGYQFAYFNNNTISYISFSAQLNKLEKKYSIASVQTHHTMEGRDIVREATLEEYKKNPKAGNPEKLFKTIDGKEKNAKDVNLWRDFPVENVGHRWGLTIDLNKCIGCGACVTACTSENNVPVVGKDEIRRVREMHWIRIDRYYSSKTDDVNDIFGIDTPAEQPEVFFQPVMCQHCNHAPCETVCPVAATTHSLEGLNMMAYNRCIGTRYCANNCPYKVRRFNWFNYYRDEKFTQVNPAQDDMGRLVLNPDVVVRSRGVMEKCSMCIQRIQEGKLKAKKESRPVKDGDIKTACVAACPTNAIKFGDLNDKNSEVRKNAESPRAYNLLEEIGTQPNVYYLTKIKN